MLVMGKMNPFKRIKYSSFRVVTIFTYIQLMKHIYEQDHGESCTQLRPFNHVLRES